MYKSIFIDWDNTLGDFNASANAALNEIFTTEKLNRFFSSCQEWIEIYEPHNIALWEQYGQGLITKQFLNEDRFDYPFRVKGFTNQSELAQHIEHLFEQRTTDLTTLIPHAEEIVQYLASRYPLTVVTNGFPEVQHRKFKETGLGQYFSHVIISEEVGASKPSKEIFNLALRANGIDDPKQAIMIGDHYSVDIEGARNAGIDQVYFCADTPEENELPATYHIHNLLEIKQIL